MSRQKLGIDQTWRLHPSNPKRNIPFVVIGAMVVGTVMYVLL